MPSPSDKIAAPAPAPAQESQILVPAPAPEPQAIALEPDQPSLAATPHEHSLASQDTVPDNRDFSFSDTESEPSLEAQAADIDALMGQLRHDADVELGRYLGWLL